MSLFERASREKTRFATSKGLLSSEDLWDLSLQRLNDVAKGLKRKLRTEAEEDFLDETPVDDEVQFQFDLVLHVLQTKKAENAERRTAKAKKEEKQKLLEILARKQDAGLEALSEDELKAKIAELTA